MFLKIGTGLLIALGLPYTLAGFPAGGTSIATASIVAGLGLVYTLIVIQFAEPIAARLGLIDHPGAQNHKKHHHPTPLVGGVACIPPAVVALFFAVAVGRLDGDDIPATWAMAVATGLSFAVGLIDDRNHIPALRRLLICGSMFLCALLIRPEFIVSALSLETLNFSVELGWLAVPFSVLCLLAFQNAVNMADGRNGLVAGLSIIWLLALLSYGQHPSNLAAIGLVIGLLAVLHANMQGRLFLGDAGTYGLGAFIGLMTIWIHRSNIGLHTIDVAVILAVPVLDMIRLFMFRLAKGQSPFAGDHDHLHHYIDSAFGWRQGRYVYYAIVAMPIAALRLGMMNGLGALTAVAILYLATLLASRWQITRRLAA